MLCSIFNVGICVNADKVGGNAVMKYCALDRKLCLINTIISIIQYNSSQTDRHLNTTHTCQQDFPANPIQSLNRLQSIAMNRIYIPTVAVATGKILQFEKSTDCNIHTVHTESSAPNLNATRSIFYAIRSVRPPLPLQSLKLM